MKLVSIIILAFLMTACKSNQLAVVKSNGKFGCINRKGEFVIQPTWDWILPGKKNKQILVEKDSLYGFINGKGQILIKPQYQDAGLFHNGLAAVKNDGKYGFINLKGETIIPFLYDDTFMGFKNGLSDVTLNDSCGYIDKSGKIIIPLIYDICYPFMSEYGQVRTFNGEELLIDKKGKTYRYDDVKTTKRLWVPRDPYPGSFTTSTGQGRINKKGDTIVPPIYRVTGNLSDHMYIVQDKNNKWGAYNDKGVLKVECKFDDIWHFYEGLAKFKLNDKWGYVDKQGKIVIEPNFEHASQFTNGLAYVVINGKSGFINKKGVFVITPRFETKTDSRFQ